jgi:hypothetical protein
MHGMCIGIDEGMGNVPDTPSLSPTHSLWIILDNFLNPQVTPQCGKGTYGHAYGLR